MPLTIKDILKFPSLTKGKLVTGEIGLSNVVNDAIIMEALDIKEWGEYGQLLLTSYFAFDHSEPQKIDQFFIQAKEIGIAGFIFKTDRLIHEIPETFLSKCKKYQFPIIRIPKNVTYPKIINDILSAINSRNAFLLKHYYDNHQKFIQLMMAQGNVSQILKTLEELIHLPITLEEKVDEKRIGTDKNYNTFQRIRELHVQKDQKINYKKLIVSYSSLKDTRVILSFPIPNLGYEEYELLIHTIDESLSDLQLMAIENAVVALQTELVKRYALRQKNSSYLNEMASELIFGRLTNAEDIQDTIQNLGLDVSKNYQLAVFSFSQSAKKRPTLELNRLTDRIGYFSKLYFPDAIYIKQTHKVILLIPLKDLSLRSVKNKLSTIFKEVTEKTNTEDFISQISISDEVSVYHLNKGYKQAMDALLVSRLWENTSDIIAYDDIGIFKLFIETENIEVIQQFVPKKIRMLHEQHPELLNTLYTFINTNQNYTKTSKLLFVHPKTVRYRINQLTKHYKFDFDDPEQMLQCNIAIRIVKFLKNKEA